MDDLLGQPPTADLLDQKPGQTDEAELRMSYADIDDYLEGKSVDERVAAAIEIMYLRTRHKRRMPVSMLNDWWR